MPRPRAYSQSALDQAVEAVRSGTSIHKASNDWGIPRTTLKGRIRGAQPFDKAHCFQQRLTQVQETELASWIRGQDALGLAPTHAQIRSLATRILRTNHDHEPLGKRWVQSFLGRNLPIRTLRSIPLDSARAKGVTPEAINQFFDRLQAEGILEIDQSNRHNMDEAGIMEGCGSNGLVVGQSEKKKTLHRDHGSKVWTTIIECIAANGTRCPPLIIFKGMSVQVQWFEQELAHLGKWRFTKSESGWTNDEIALEWLKKVFIPETKPADPSQKRLLILDGHGSHLSDEFMFAAQQAKVHLLYLPPHTTHVLQPLDIGIFSQLKRAYRTLLQYEPISVHWNCPIGKAGFLRLYSQARDLAITPDNIASAWRGAGLWPIDREKILRSRFILEPAPTPPPSPPPPPPETNPYVDANGEIQPPNWLPTPKKSRDVIVAAQRHFALDFNEPIRRILFEKVGRGIDIYATRLATVEAERDSLQQQLVAKMQVTKRGKVVPEDPNDYFVRIEDILRTREKMAARLDPVRTSDDAQYAGMASLCSEWQVDFD